MKNWKKARLAALAGGSVLGMGAMSAHAAIDASVGTAITGIVTDATSLNSLIVPAVITVLGMGVVIKLIKRFGNKI